MGVGTVFRRDSARRRVSGRCFGSLRPSGGCLGAVAGAFCAGQCQDRLACGLNRRWKVAGIRASRRVSVLQPPDVLARGTDRGSQGREAPLVDDRGCE